MLPLADADAAMLSYFAADCRHATPLSPYAFLLLLRRRSMLILISPMLPAALRCSPARRHAFRATLMILP